MTTEPDVGEPVDLIAGARLVPIGPAPEARDGTLASEPVDVRLDGGRVIAVATRLDRAAGDRVFDADGRWLMPGLWDAHTHPVMWALARTRIDLAGTADQDDACVRVRDHLAANPGSGLVLGYGHRSALWPRPPTVAALDAVTGGRPVALTAGDGHNGWLNSAALRLIGHPGADGVLAENDWFTAYPRLDAHARAVEDQEAALRSALTAAAALGIVGIVDLEFDAAWRAWRERLECGYRPPVRVRAATYAATLEEVGAAGLRTGDPLLAGAERVTMGPLKAIGDGSLNTLTAWCCAPYAPDADPAHAAGRPNHEQGELVALMGRAHALGLTTAIHAIGDRAVGATIAAYAATGARGTIEHAQLIGPGDAAAMAALPITASVQPAHLLDDRDVTQRYWPDRTDRVFAFRALLDAGVPLALGSDAPVAPLDPWLAMAAAVHRSGDERPAWHPEQALTIAEALAASTDGRGTVSVGSPADLVLVDHDPYAVTGDTRALGAHLRGVRVAATMVGGALTHRRT